VVVRGQLRREFVDSLNSKCLGDSAGGSGVRKLPENHVRKHFR
jgi:hypothetical protein